jgi:hypothetical protein
MHVEEPQWVELQREEDTSTFERELDNFIKNNSVSPRVVVIVLKNENLYGIYKNICYSR